MEEEQRILNPQQEHFCQLYTSRSDFAKKGYKCYAEAYGFELPLKADGSVDYTTSEYRTCAVNASRLLVNPKIATRIRDIYLELLTDENVDARLNEIIRNGQESNSIQAIKIANDLKQRITKRIDVTSGGRPLANLSDEELKALAE